MKFSELCTELFNGDVNEMFGYCDDLLTGEMYTQDLEIPSESERIIRESLSQDNDNDDGR